MSPLHSIFRDMPFVDRRAHSGRVRRLLREHPVVVLLGARQVGKTTLARQPRELEPWAENIAKRVVKSPKIYISDPGLLHALLDVTTPSALERHPKLGASWEGFVLGQVVRRLRARPSECHFWGVHAGPELDLVIVSGGRRLGFEIKRTDSPRLTASLRSAFETLRLDSLDLIHAGESTFPLAEDVRAVAVADLKRLVRPLRRD